MKKWFDDWNFQSFPSGEFKLSVPHSFGKETAIHIKGKFTRKHIQWMFDMLMCAFHDLNELTKSKDQAYWERNQLLYNLAKQYRKDSHMCLHPEEDKSWERDWMWIVCLHTPAGQMTWHIHDSESQRFRSLLGVGKNHWDGHTTEDKYKRLETL